MTYSDLLIHNGDVVLDSGHNPVFVTDRAMIAQDIVHSILDAGLAHKLVADRGSGVVNDVKTQIELLVEDDQRIMPGTIVITETAKGEWWISADTIDFGPINSQLVAGV